MLQDSLNDIHSKFLLYLVLFLKALKLNVCLIIAIESERTGYHRSQGRIQLLDIEKLIPTCMNT